MAFEKDRDEDAAERERDADAPGGASERSESDVEGAEGASTRDADDTGDEGSDRESSGFRKRVSKLTAQRREAEKERDAALTELNAYRAREREAKREAKEAEAATPAGMKLAERRALIRQANDAAYGDGYSDWVERERYEREQERNLQKEQYALNGVSYLKSELEDHGVPVDDRALVRWERAIGSELAENVELLAKFRRPATQREAIREAVELVRDGLANPLIKQRGGQPLERIERNRNAVLGSGRSQGGGDPDQEFGEDYVAKPPKGSTPEQEAAYWDTHRSEMWAKLNKRA